jgi:hypothetical protein
MTLLLSLPLGLLILLGVGFTLTLLAVVWENPGLATFNILTTTLAMWWFFDIPIFSTFWENPALLVAIVPTYIALGTGWSLIRWWLYVSRIRDQFLDAKSDWQAKNKGTDDDWWCSWPGEEWAAKIPPLASQHKEIITLWILYWPWSMVWTLVDDPFRRLAQWAYRKIQHSYVWITNKIFAGIQIPPVEEVQRARRIKEQQSYNDHRRD